MKKDAWLIRRSCTFQWHTCSTQMDVQESTAVVKDADVSEDMGQTCAARSIPRSDLSTGFERPWVQSPPTTPPSEGAATSPGCTRCPRPTIVGQCRAWGSRKSIPTQTGLFSMGPETTLLSSRAEQKNQLLRGKHQFQQQQSETRPMLLEFSVRMICFLHLHDEFALNSRKTRE